MLVFQRLEDSKGPNTIAFDNIFAGTRSINLSCRWEKDALGTKDK